MKKLAFLPVLILLSLLSTGAQAGVTAGQLYVMCTHAFTPSSEAEKTMLDESEATCNAFFLGFTEGLFVATISPNMPKQDRACFPKDMSIEPNQARELFQKYIEGHAKEMSTDPGIVAGAALTRAFPCSN